MIIQCPHCQTNFRLDEKAVGDQPSLQFRCNKCGEAFSVPLPTLAGPMGARPVPVQQHDEFNKRLRAVTPASSPDPLKATMIRGNSRSWLDRDKVISLVAIDGPLKG